MWLTYLYQPPERITLYCILFDKKKKKKWPGQVWKLYPKARSTTPLLCICHARGLTKITPDTRDMKKHPASSINHCANERQGRHSFKQLQLDPLRPLIRTCSARGRGGGQMQQR